MVNNKTGDIVLACVSLAQSPLMILQLFITGTGIVTEDMASLLRLLCSALLGGLSFVYLIRRNFFLLLVAYLSSFSVLTYYLLFFEATEPFILDGALKFTLPISLPTVLSLFCIKDYNLFKRVLYQFSRIICVIGILYGILNVTGLLAVTSFYSMPYSYALLLPIMLLVISKSIIDKILVFFSFILIFIMGSRGPLGIILAFIILYIFIVGNLKMRIILLMCFITILLLVPYFFKLIEAFDIQSRTLILLMDGALDSDSGRSDIYNIIWEKIAENPFWGYGIGADRTFLDGAYVHNIILEFWIDFGLFIGSFFLFLLFFKTWNVFRLSSIKYDKLLVLIVFLAGFVPLLFSGSYLIFFNFSFLIGFLLLASKSQRIVCKLM